MVETKSEKVNAILKKYDVHAKEYKQNEKEKRKKKCKEWIKRNCLALISLVIAVACLIVEIVSIILR